MHSLSLQQGQVVLLRKERPLKRISAAVLHKAGKVYAWNLSFLEPQEMQRAKLTDSLAEPAAKRDLQTLK